MAKRDYGDNVKIEIDSSEESELEFEDDAITSSESDSDYEYSSEEMNSSDSSGHDDPSLLPSMPLDSLWVSKGDPRPCFTFVGNAGIQHAHLSKNDILSIFQCFFTDEIIGIIVMETNRYAAQSIEKNKDNLSRNLGYKDWKPTNAQEIKTFLGVLIIQGICLKPESKMYFSRRQSIETPFFRQVISGKRYHLLLKCLCFANNDDGNTHSRTKKLFKISPIVNHLRDKFMTVYIPNKDINVDESHIGWKDRVNRKQCITNKRKKFGIKLFMLCESDSGYIYNFIIYTRANTIYGESRYANEPVTSRVVLELSHTLLDKGYCIYLGNSYCSPELTDKLTDRQTDVVGTMSIDKKGIPSEIKTIKLNKGEMIAMYRRKQMILKFKDKGDVIMTSSIHDDSTEFVMQWGGTLQTKPSVVIEYNSKTRGIDLDELSAAGNRFKKFETKLFQHFLDLTTWNCYQIYKKLGGKKKRLNFLLDLGEKLIEQNSEKMEVEQQRSRFTGNHFPEIIPPTKKIKPTKRCVLCFKKGIRKESRYWCPICSKGLCPAPCFGEYHIKQYSLK